MERNPKHNWTKELELFDRYQMQKMNVTERDAFEQRLKTDLKLKETFNEYMAMVYVVEESALKKKIDVFHSDLDLEKEKVVSLRKSKRINYLVAASIALLIGLGGLWLFNLQNQNLFDEYFTADPGLPTVMSNSDDYKFYEAMVDYKRKGYNRAIEKWEMLLVQKPQNDTLNYFLGSAYLANKQEETSVMFLKKVASNKNSVFYSEANFYLGLVHLKMGQENKAIDYLKKSDSKTAVELISKINKKN